MRCPGWSARCRTSGSWSPVRATSPRRASASRRALRSRVELLGLVSEEVKPRVFRSVDVYCAPNTGQESFGIILLEAMAADTPVVASDIEAFRQVLDDGRAGRLFPVGDSDALADALVASARRPRGAAGLSPSAAGGGPAPTTGRSSPQAVVQVYEAVTGILSTA